MGQQQLLLLVLGIVIVGLAVVVGIQSFSENQKKANADALVGDVVQVAADAQAWRLKPQAMGGGRGATIADVFSLENMGYQVEDVDGTDMAVNLNGQIQAYVSGGTRIVIIADNADTNVRVVGVVNGTTPECIATYVTTPDDSESKQASQEATCENY